MKKRIISLLLMAVLLFSLMPAAAFADSTAISNIYLELTVPEAGKTPSWDVSAALSPLDSETKPELLYATISWMYYDDSTEDLEYVDDFSMKFTPTQYYFADVTVTVPEGKTIPTKGTGDKKHFTGTVWVNGEKTECFAYPKNGKLVIELDYLVRPTDKSKIVSSFTFDNVPTKAYVGTLPGKLELPTLKKNPGIAWTEWYLMKYDKNGNLTGLYIPPDYMNKVARELGISYEAVSKGNKEFGSTFEKDSIYALYFSVELKDGYAFSLDSVDIVVNTTDGKTETLTASVLDDDVIVVGTIILDTVEVKSLAKPTLTVKTDASRLKPKWNAVPGATKYEVYRSTDNKNFKKIATVTGTSYLDKNSGNGVRYYYKVRAVNVNGSKTVYGSYSSVKSSTVLEKPTINRVIEENSGITLKWSKVPGADKYYIYRSTDGESFTKIKTVTGTSYTDTKIVSGTTYTYRIAPVAADFVGDYSWIFIPYFARPTVSVAKADNGIKLTWKAVPGAEKYQVFRSADNKEFTYMYTTSKLSYTDTSAVAGTKYCYKVRTRAAIDSRTYYSQYSAIKSYTILDVPTVTAKLSGTSAVLSWTNVAGAEKYKIYRSTDGKSFSLLKTVTGTSYTDKSLTKGSTYYYKVRAATSSNSGGYSEVVSLKIMKAPSVTLNTWKTGEVGITWKAISGAVKYQVYRSTDNKSFKLLSTVKGTSLTNSKVTSGTKYYYKVRAVDAAGGVSDFSSVKSIVSTPAPIVNLSGDKISWSAVKGAAKYEVYACEDLMSGKSKLYKTTSSCSVNIKKGSAYQVLAVYNIGGKTYKSALSNVIFA